MYTVGPRSVRVISRELATPPLLTAAAFSGMPMRVTSSLGQVRKLAAGWVPDGTAPELKDAVVNKMIFPVGVRFLEHEGDRSIFRDLRGGEVTPVEVFDVGDVRGSKKSKTVLVLAADYQGYVCCKALTGPSFQRLQLAANLEMQDGTSALAVREAAAISGLDQSPVALAPIQSHIQDAANAWMVEHYDRLVRPQPQGGCGMDATKVSLSGWFEREPAHLRGEQRRLTDLFPARRARTCARPPAYGCARSTRTPVLTQGPSVCVCLP